MSFSREGLGFQRRKKSTRTFGDAPTMGSVPRMHPNAKGLRARISFAGKIPLVLLGVMIFLLGAGITGLVIRFANDPQKAARPNVTPPPSPNTTAIPKVPVPSPRDLESIVASFVASRDRVSLEPLVRGSSQRFEVIAEKLAQLESKDGKISAIRHLGAVDSGCVQAEAVTVNFDSGRNRVALLSPDDAGKWRIDFDAFDRHVTPDWKTILSSNPAESTVRVYLSHDNYYNGRYRDDRQWACFAMVSPDHETLLYGYAKRGSRQHLAIASTLKRKLGSTNSRTQRMTLSMLHSGTGDHRQFEITRALSDDWALGTEPLDSQIGSLDASTPD